MKKTLTHPKATPAKRFAFCRKIKRYEAAKRPLVYIDESGFAHDMVRTHGYAPKGKRCYDVHDWGAKGQTNVIGALVGKALVTVSLFNANTNTDIFTARIKQGPIPKLPKESVIIMDNAAFHKGENMKKAIGAAGHTLEYLPPYSPNLNPIEKKMGTSKKETEKKRKCSIQEFFKQNKF